MKPYGSKKHDLPFDCTDHSSYNLLTLRMKCSCGCKKQKPSRNPKKIKAIKARQRVRNSIKITDYEA